MIVKITMNDNANPPIGAGLKSGTNPIDGRPLRFQRPEKVPLLRNFLVSLFEAYAGRAAEADHDEQPAYTQGLHWITESDRTPQGRSTAIRITPVCLDNRRLEESPSSAAPWVGDWTVRGDDADPAGRSASVSVD